MPHQAVHSLTSHTAQIHFYGSLLFGLIYSLLAVGGLFGLVRTTRRRSKQDIIATLIIFSGFCLTASGIIDNAFIPLKPHHSMAVFIPLHGMASILFLSGFGVNLLGICLMPKGEAGKWLPDNKRTDEYGTIDPKVWPPAPKS